MHLSSLPLTKFRVHLCVSCRHYSLQQLLDPLTVTWERLDYRLSWHLWGVLQALHYSHLSASRQGLLHASYAAQLESAGLWHMAVFILLHIPDHTYVHLLAECFRELKLSNNIRLFSRNKHHAMMSPFVLCLSAASGSEQSGSC